jgi:hypothetical protein
MDRVYQAGIPKYKKALEALGNELSRVPLTTDWAKLRVAPLLAHAGFLNRLLRSPQFAQETRRLRNGVVMFHADLVYLRTNIRALKEILAAAKPQPAARKRPKARHRR